MTCINNAGAEIVQIRSLLKEIKFEVKFKLIKGQLPINYCMNEIPLQCLIKMRNIEVGIMQEDIENEQEETNIKIHRKMHIESE